MTTIKVTALDSFVHGTYNVHKHARLELPEGAARDLIKTGLLREGHDIATAAAASPAAPVQKPGRGKRAPSNKATGPQDNKGADDGGAPAVTEGDGAASAPADGAADDPAAGEAAGAAADTQQAAA